MSEVLHGTRNRHALGKVLALATIVAVWFAQPVTAQDVGLGGSALSERRWSDRDWFEREWADASDWRPDRPLYIEFRIITRSRTSPAFVERVRSEIDDKPDHPHHRFIDAWAYDASTPEQVTRTRLWLDDDLWRYSIDTAEGSGLANEDFAVGPNESWGIFNGYLRVYDNDRPPDTSNNRGFERLVRQRLQQLFHHGFFGREGPSPNVVVSSRVDAMGRWRGVVESKDGLWQTTFLGERVTHGPDNYAIRVTGARQTKAPIEPYPWDGFDVLEWGALDGFEGEFPVRIALRHALPGRPEATEPWPELVIDRVELVSPAEVRRMVRTPMPGEDDPIRGTVDVDWHLDLRPGAMELHTMDGSTVVRTDEVANVTLPPGSMLRPIGWVVAIIIVLAVLGTGAYLRRRTS